MRSMTRPTRATRFTVSLPDPLMRTLDRLRSGRGYSNRSEFVRDLLRGELVKKEWEDQAGETVGVLVRLCVCMITIRELWPVSSPTYRGHPSAGFRPACPEGRESSAFGQGCAVWAARPCHDWQGLELSERGDRDGTRCMARAGPTNRRVGDRRSHFLRHSWRVGVRSATTGASSQHASRDRYAG